MTTINNYFFLKNNNKKKKKERENKKKRKKENYRAVIRSIEMQIMVHPQLLFGTESSCLQVRDLNGFIYTVD